MTDNHFAVNQHFINGKWTEPSRPDTVDVIDSNTAAVIGHAPAGTSTDVEAAVQAADAALPGWRATSPAERAQYLRAIADGLARRQEELAQLIAREVGAPLPLARGSQTQAAVGNFTSSAAIAESFEYRTALGNSWIVREPIGVVGAITAWNFPLHLVTVKAAYAMAAGNTVVVKPSEVAPLTAAVLCEIVAEAGLPAGVFNVVFGSGREVGEAIVTHPTVRMVTFTGSTRAGKRIGELAASQVKKVTLELGGKSPQVVLPGADLEQAVAFGVADLMINNGQRCDALTRMVVPRDRLAEVEQAVTKTVAEYQVGDSTQEGTQVGPMVSAVQRDRVVGYIRTGIEEGAKLLVGGPEAPDLPDALSGGYFVRPTVFSEVERTMTVAQDEIFGPVLAIQPYDDVEDALAIANDTVYGLHASVWATTDEEAIEVASRIEAGMVTINAGVMNMDAPFGGYKQSGIGREYGRFGFEEFLEIKKLETAAPLDK